MAWKGFEHDLVQKMKKLGFADARRLFEQFDKGGGIDIRAGKWVLQLKYGLKPNIIKAFYEVDKDKEKGEIPVAVIRLSQKRDTIVALRWADFEDLLEGQK